ncbi:MAG: hypothetical protein ACJA1N_000148 [Saprospiraceae bacterium]
MGKAADHAENTDFFLKISNELFYNVKIIARWYDKARNSQPEKQKKPFRMNEMAS